RPVLNVPLTIGSSRYCPRLHRGHFGHIGVPFGTTCPCRDDRKRSREPRGPPSPATYARGTASRADERPSPSSRRPCPACSSRPLFRGRLLRGQTKTESRDASTRGSTQAGCTQALAA